MRLVLVTLAFVGALQAQVINEFVANHTGTDTNEFIEFYGAPNTSYSTYFLIVCDGDVGENPGQVDLVYNVGTTNATGHWYTGFVNSQMENDETLTILLVENFSGIVGDDIDTNDDGVIDNVLWTNLVDSIGVTDEGAGDHNYGPGVTLAPFYDGISFIVAGASRVPDGMNTTSVTDWVRNDFHGAGMGGFPGTIAVPEAYNTPDAPNQAYSPPPDLTPMITEFVFSHTGQDDYEFVEIVGTPLASYSGYRLLMVEGDMGENPGQIDMVVEPGTTDISGFWASGFFMETLEDGAATLLLVEGFTGALSDDLDTNDDGTLDVTPWTTLVDSVATTNSGGAVVLYSSAAVGTVGGASRFPYYVDTDSASDWVMNDPDLLGIIGAGGIGSDEAYNTPAAVNRVSNTIYYASVSTGSAVALRNSVHQAILGHIKFPYTDTFTDTWDILEQADENPSNSSNIIDVYKNESYAKQGGGNSFYNREHTWAKSYGFPDDNDDAMPYTDCHHLRLCDIGYNSDRGNAPFNDCPGCTERTTTINNGFGGPGQSNWFDGSGTGNNFEVWDHRKGDIARSMLYMDLRYEGGMHPFRMFSEPNLELTDMVAQIQTTGTNTTGTAYLGLRQTLLDWHAADPVDDEERARNEVVYRYQGNRNPFVDHPEWADCIYNGNCGPGLPACFLPLLSSWTTGPALSCSTGMLSVLDFAGLIDGTCTCPSPIAVELITAEIATR